MSTGGGRVRTRGPHGQWAIVLPREGVKHSQTLQPGRTVTTLCSVKEARLQRSHAVRFLLYEMSRVGKPRVRKQVCPGLGERGWGLAANGMGSPWWGMKEFWNYSE